MAESDCEKEHSFRNISTPLLHKSGDGLMSPLNFRQQLTSKFSFPVHNEAEPHSYNQEESSPVTETLSSFKSMAQRRTLDFEKIYSIVENVLFNPSEREEINDENETWSTESAEDVPSARFHSMFTHNLPLYQDYCLQDTSEDVQTFEESSESEFIVPQCVQRLQAPLEKVYQSQTWSPLFSPTLFPFCSTPPPPPPPSPAPIKVTPSHSTLWQDLEEVKESSLFQNLSPKEIRIHETAFELICSEASYLRSLEIAVNHFYASKALRQTMTQMEHHFLFSNIQRVMAASEKFLSDLERQLGECILVGLQVGGVVLQHCPAFQRLYVPYVTNMMYQEALIRQLLQQNKDFRNVLAKLEKSPVCQRRNLKSFLALPFQRITRIKLLLEAIFKLTKLESSSLANLEKAIQAVHEVVQECDDGVRKMKQIEELVCLEMQLDFSKVKSIPLVTSGRFLMHQGPMKQLSLESSVHSRLSFTNVYLHLLSDMLIISSKREEQFEVQDHAEFPAHLRCERFKAEVLGLPPNSFLLHLFKRKTGPATVLVLVTDTWLAKETWMKLLSSKE